MDKHCVSCHRPDSGNEKAAPFDLTAAKSYDSLLGFAEEDLKKLAFEKSRSLVGECPAAQSKLLALLIQGKGLTQEKGLAQEKGHEGVTLDAESLDRLITWMDVYAHRLGSFSPEQEDRLRQFRQQLAPMLTD